MIVQKQMIPHLKGLVMGDLIPEGKGRGVIRGLPRPLFVKSVFEREPLMLEKQMIPHLKALDVGYKLE